MYWQDRRILITGANGFVGTNLVNRFRSMPVDEQPELILPYYPEYDLCNMTRTENMFADDISKEGFSISENKKIDIVIHLAADVGGIEYNKDNAASIFDNNLRMGLNIFKAARKYKVEKLINISSACVYSNDALTREIYPKEAFDENDIWYGAPEESNKSYGIAKRAILELSESYFKQYGFNSINLIPTNMYGEHETTDKSRSHVIPAAIRKMLVAKELGLSSVFALGNGMPIRDFIHVNDLVDAILYFGKRRNSYVPVNISINIGYSIKKLYSMIANIVGYNGEIKWSDDSMNGQSKRILNNDKAKRLGFETKINLITGLASTVKYWENKLKIIKIQNKNLLNWEPVSDKI